MQLTLFLWRTCSSTALALEPVFFLYHETKFVYEYMQNTWESKNDIKRDRKKCFQRKEMQAHYCSFKPLQF